MLGASPKQRHIVKEMIDSDSTICLTLAGAMTPIGLGKTIATMIENGFIDWIVSTGANVYHDLHFAYDLPVRQGHYDVDDDLLYENQIVRIYDTYIKEVGTLQAQDRIIQRNMTTMKSPNDGDLFQSSTADFTFELGKTVKKKAKHLKNPLLSPPTNKMSLSTFLQSATLQ